MVLNLNMLISLNKLIQNNEWNSGLKAYFKGILQNVYALDSMK